MYIPKSHRHGFKAASTLVQDDLHPNTSNHGLSGAITSSEIHSDQNDVMKSAVNQRSRARSREAELPKQLGSLADGDFRMQTKILKSIFKEDDRLGADVPSKGSTVGEPNRYTGCPAPCDYDMKTQKESKYAMMWLAPLPLTATSDSKLSRKSVLTKCSIETYENLIAELNVVPMNLVREIVSYKNELDNLSQDEYQRRRNRLFSSKYVKTYQYGNRAGSKLEDVFRYSDLQGAITNAWLLYSRHSDKFVFADICGGPGAFSQMIFAWVQDKLLLPLKQVHGYGITLRDSESCKWYTTLTSMSQFSPFYGANGQGNIYCKQTRAEFVAHCGCLLPLIVADGGFELQGSQESLQEMLTAHLILCECLLAIQLLSPGGCFILKCFDTLCPFIVSILSDLRRMFQKVGICKPETSRVTNAERYIVCVGFLTSASDASVKDSILSMWGSYADELYTSSFSDKRRENEDANAQKNTSVIPVTIIPLEEFQSEAYEEFLGSVRRVTYYIMSQQAKALRRILDSDTHE